VTPPDPTLSFSWSTSNVTSGYTILFGIGSPDPYNTTPLPPSGSSDFDGQTYPCTGAPPASRDYYLMIYSGNDYSKPPVATAKATVTNNGDHG